MKLHYGGTRSHTSLNIHLEPMRCYGKNSFYPSELASAERSILRSDAIKLKEELMEKIDFIAVSFHIFDILNLFLCQGKSQCYSNTSCVLSRISRKRRIAKWIIHN